MIQRLLFKLFGIVVDVIEPIEAAKQILSHAEDIHVVFEPKILTVQKHVSDDG